MLTEALGIGRSFHQEDIANLRQHITLQLLRGDLFLPDYRIHSVLPRRSSTPHSTHSQSDLEAAASLLDLSGAQPRVRFSTEIEVREYNGKKDFIRHLAHYTYILYVSSHRKRHG
jgi:hypothetical protein